MVEHNDLQKLNSSLVNQGRTGDIPRGTSKGHRFNEVAEQRRKNSRHVSTLDYVTEWNLPDDESDEHRS